MRKYGKWLFTAAVVTASGGVVSANAADVMKAKTVGAYRGELHVLPAEPFFSKEEVAAKQVKEGMEIEGGVLRSCWMRHRILIIIVSCTSSTATPAATPLTVDLARPRMNSASAAPLI